MVAGLYPIEGTARCTAAAGRASLAVGERRAAARRRRAAAPCGLAALPLRALARRAHKRIHHQAAAQEQSDRLCNLYTLLMCPAIRPHSLRNLGAQGVI